MLKKLKELLRRDPEQFRIPRSVQEVIPIRTVWKSGIFLVGPNRYSRTWQFSDINYALAGEENQKSMLLQYATAQGWEIYGIYSDDDYTGADRSRPEFNRLLEDAKHKKFDIVL